MFKLNNTYMAEADEGDQGDGGGGGDDDKTFKQSDMDGLQSQIDALVGKNDELIGEKKAAKTALRIAEDEARKTADDKAAKDGDFEQLYKSSQEVNGTLQSTIDQLHSDTAGDKQKAAATKIATQLAEGDNIGLLSQFIAPRLKYTDGGVKVLDNSGQLTVSTVEQLQTEFQNNKTYASLLKGNQSNGGGANGGGNGGGAAGKTMTRTDFNAMDPGQQMKFATKDKGQVTD